MFGLAGFTRGSDIIISTVINWLERLFSNFHNFAALTSTIISIIGVLAAGATTSFAELVIRRRQKTIRNESGKNFSISTGYSYTVHKDGDITAFPEDISTSTTEGSNWSSTQGETFGTSQSYNKSGTEQPYKARSRISDSARNIRDHLASSMAKDQVRKRLQDIIEERERQHTIAKWSRGASRTLTFGQYIIGALLTTSLAQGSISKTWLSVFGLLVILCSATKQHFHVDESAQGADVRFRKLRSLVRYAQDQIAILEIRSVNGENRTDAYVALLSEITESLSQVESNEAPYLPKPPAFEKDEPATPARNTP